MRKHINSLIIQVKLYYYSFLEYLDEKLNHRQQLDLNIKTIERHQENAKLARGIRRLVKRLRSMSPEERLSTENLLSKDTYKKSLSEKMAEIRVRDKVNKNPLIKSEDELVKSVVKRAPIYQKEAEAKDVRKAITASLRRASEDPSNPTHQQDIMALRAKLKALKAEIQRMKDG